MGLGKQQRGENRASQRKKGEGQIEDEGKEGISWGLLAGWVPICFSVFA